MSLVYYRNSGENEVKYLANVPMQIQFQIKQYKVKRNRLFNNDWVLLKSTQFFALELDRLLIFHFHVVLKTTK